MTTLKDTGEDNMKKYIYEVGISIQTVYLWPEANDADEAGELAEIEFEKLTENWQGFDLDYSADFVQIHCMTQEYKNLLNLPDDGTQGYSDGEVLDILFEDTGTHNTADLIKLVKKCCSSVSKCDIAHGREMGND